jgi:hypothetical protein
MSDLSYSEFGGLFVRQVVTPERVRDTMWSLAGGELSTSIRLAGGIVRAEGKGEVTDVSVERRSDDPLAYRVTLVATLRLIVRVAGVPHRYDGDLRVPLELRVSTKDDLSLGIDIADVGADDIDMNLRPAGTAASFVEQIGQVNAQARREVAQLVNERKNSQQAMAVRRIDVGPAIDAEWKRRQG